MPSREEDLLFLDIFEGPRTLKDPVYLTDEESSRLCELAATPNLITLVTDRPSGLWPKNVVMVLAATARARTRTRPEPIPWEGWPLGEPEV